jgi:hypothetical protein
VFACLAGLAGLLSLHANTFTTPITISETDTAYDGQDIVISNTVVTLDRAHSFNSLLLTSGAVLTHSPCTASVIHMLDLPCSLQLYGPKKRSNPLALKPVSKAASSVQSWPSKWRARAT